MQRRIEHVAHVEGHLAEWQLDERVRRRKLRDEAIHVRRCGARGDEFRQRRQAGLFVVGGIAVERQRDRDRLDDDERTGQR